MSARENFGSWTLTHTVAILICAATLATFSPLRPGLLLPALSVLLLLLMVPVLVRLCWPTLADLTFLTAPQLLLTVLSVVGCIVSLAASASHRAPLWLLIPVIICLLVTSLGIRHQYRRHLRLQRKLMHICPACAYDLRASVERCPECGAPIPDDYRFYLTRDLTSPLLPKGSSAQAGS